MALLEVKDLHTSFFTDAGEVRAVDLSYKFSLDEATEKTEVEPLEAVSVTMAVKGMV